MKRRVLVTGGTGTLGSALIAALTHEGCEVTANFCHDENRAMAVALKTGCLLKRGDIGDEGFVEHLFSSPFQAVFHLAGISHDALLPRVSPASWNEGLKINLDSAFLVTRASLRYSPVGSHLILVGSRVGEQGYPGQSAYGASKAALVGLMRTAAIEGRERNIKVNVVCPGFMPSKMSESLSAAVIAARARENWLSNADGAESFAALCVSLLQLGVSGQVLRPDCRI